MTYQRQEINLQSILTKLGKGAKFTVITSHKYATKDAMKARAILDRLVSSVDVNEVASIEEVIPQINEM